MFGPHRKHTLWASTACYGNSFIFPYVDDVRISQETHLWASTACYGNSFSFPYVDDIRISQETHLWASTACYGNSVTVLFVDDVHTSHEHIYKPPRPVTRIVLVFLM
jgi:hypothetical protein